MTSPKSVWSRQFFPVLFVYFIDNFGLAIVYPIFTPLFLKPTLNLLGADLSLFHRTFLLGLLIASFPLAQFFGAPLIGELSDQQGRKKIFIHTILGGIIGYFLTGIGIQNRELSLIWIGRILTGLFAGNLTLCLAAIADISSTRQKRASNFGWVGTLGGLAFILAILIGGDLSDPQLHAVFRPAIPFLLTALFSCLNLALLLYYFKESYPATPSNRRLRLFAGMQNIKSAIKTPGLRTIYGIYFLFMVGWVTSMQFLSAYLIGHFDTKQGTIIVTFTLVGVAWSLSNFLINPFLAKKFPPQHTFFMTLLALSLFLYLTLIPGQSLLVFLIHFISATFCAALSWTCGLTTISLAASRFVQGSILGVNQSIGAIASIVGPILGGVIAGIAVNWLYLFTGSCTLLAALLLFKQLPKIKTIP